VLAWDGPLVSSLAIRPGGTRLAAGGKAVGVPPLGGSPGPPKGGIPTLQVWDVAAGRRLDGFAVSELTTGALAFAHDGRTLAAALADHSVRLWDATSGTQRASLRGHEKEVTDVVFSADGKNVFTTGRDGTLRLWEPVTGRHLLTLAGAHRGPTDDRPGRITVSPEGHELTVYAIGHENATLQCWRAFSPPGPQGPVAGRR
jgi:WD40 repeat protein